MKQNIKNILPVQYKELIRIWRMQTGRPTATDRLTPAETKILSGSVREISRGLTGERMYAAERYMDEPALLGAYLLYYWPVSFAQIASVLARLNLKGTQALDFGAGPGPVSLALANLGYTDITAVDRSKNALNLAANLMKSQQVRFVTKQQNLEQQFSIEQKKYDLIVCGHVINELWKQDSSNLDKRTELLKNLASGLKDDGRLIVMEPALLSTTRDLLAVRDMMLKAGFSVEYPCTLQADCPCLTADKATCHSEYLWDLPHSVKQIALEAGIDKSTLKTAVLVFTKKNLNRKNSEKYRVVSERMLSNSGKWRFMICGKAGRITLSMKTGLEESKAGKVFKNLKRSDLIEFSGCTSRENGFEIVAESTLRLN